MAWSGTTRWGPAWAGYRGPSSENAPHEHVAIQIVKSCTDQPVSVSADQGLTYEAVSLVIRPLVRHAISPHPDVGILYLEPQSRLAMWLVDSLDDGEVAALPRPLCELLNKDRAIETWAGEVQDAAESHVANLDPRVVEALRLLALQPQSGAIEAVAAQVGLSDSRLRALVRGQLGVPLSTWLIWRKLERTSLSLAEGASMASAAAEGGFADQAHFCRTMRRMFGITPRMASTSLRTATAAGTPAHDPYQS